MNKNIFQSLSKYNKLHNENYLTESFTYILNYLNDNDKETLLELLNTVFLSETTYDILIDKNISINTQMSAEEYGRPDIFISTDNSLIIIEVKEESPLGCNQLQRYSKYLSDSDVENTFLILLSKYNCEYDADVKLDNHIFWYNIYNFFEKKQFNNQILEYLRKQFIEFMEAKQMVQKKISWEYEKGIESMNNIIVMLQTILDILKIKIYRQTAGWNWRGYYLGNNTDKYLGIYYDREIGKVYYQISLEREKWDSKKYKGKYEIEEDKYLSITFDFKKHHFYCLEKDEQISVLKEFIEETHNLSDELIIK